MSNAGVYKVKWDKGVQGGAFEDLIDSPAGTVYLNNSNTQNILGSATLKAKGGIFHFKVAYLSKNTGKESDASDTLTVTIKPSSAS